jgi:hypothetical protein
MEGIEMLAATRIDSSDSSTTMTPARPTPVVDVDDWLNRAPDPVRAFTSSICEYVPRHRAEAASAS